jgi:hypothetical protein
MKECSLTYSQELATGTYHKQYETSPDPKIYFLKIHFNFTSPSALNISSPNRMVSVFRLKLYKYLVSPMRSSCHSSLFHTCLTPRQFPHACPSLPCVPQATSISPMHTSRHALHFHTCLTSSSSFPCVTSCHVNIPNIASCHANFSNVCLMPGPSVLCVLHVTLLSLIRASCYAPLSYLCLMHAPISNLCLMQHFSFHCASYHVRLLLERPP